jgi:uncharacterized protein YdhG (YjbR/CyaY superfamily)
MTKPLTIDEYISGFPKETGKKLQQLRTVIKKLAPEATEVISYGMPAFKLKGMLVWFAAHTKHIGLYPRASAIAAFQKELSGYKNAKGSVQFPLDKPLPVELIKRIIQFRIAENEQKVIAKKK